MKKQSYLYGNVVPKEVPEPGREPVRKKKKKKRTRSYFRIRRNQQRALSLNLPYVILFSLAVCCVLFILFGYLSISTSINTRITNIASLEKELEELKTENDALETRIHTNLDLNRIYQIATEELGMVYANPDQVLLYERSPREYVRQYEDVPDK